MLNLDGLGIGVDYEDGGARESVDKLSKSVDTLFGSLGRVGGAFINAGDKMVQNFSNLGGLGRRSMGGITNAVSSMVDAAMNPQLDSAYASMYAGFNKSFSAMTVGIKATSKEMDQARKAIGGAAFSLNEDMDSAAQSWAAFRKQGLDLGEVLGTKGLSGQMKDLIKITSVFGIEGEQLSSVMSGLVRGFGFTEDKVGGLADKLYVVGKQFNAGREAVQAWPAIFEALNNELADFGKNMSPDEIEDLTVSVVKLGGGLSKALGVPAQSAMEIARTAFTTLAGERKNIINMFRGMGGEFGDVARQLMETGGDANKVFEMMVKGDPLKFMDMLRAMSDEAQKTGGESSVAFQRLSAVMSSAIGPDVAFAAKGSWDSVQDTMAKIPDVIAGGKARGALKAAARQHHKTGLTAGEGWDRMVQGMKARLFKLSDKEVGGWQKNMKKGFNETFSTISRLAKADGPVGELTKRLLAVNRVGLSALIPGFQGLMPLMSGVASSMVPAMTALGSMGLTFGGLGKMAMGGGALWLVFDMLKKGPKEAIADVKDLASNIWDTLGELFPELVTQAEGFFDYLKSGEALADIGRILSKIDFAGFGDLLGGVMVSIGSALAGIDWMAVARVAFDLLLDAAVALGGFFSALIGGADAETIEGPMTAHMGNLITNVMIGAQRIVLAAVGSFWDEILSADSLGEAFSKLSRIAVIGFGGLFFVFKGFRTKVTMGVRAMMSNMALSTMNGFTGVATLARHGVKKVGRAIKKALKASGPLVAIMAIMEGMQQLQERTANSAKIMADTTVSASEKAALGGEQAFLGVLGTIDAVLLGIPSSIGNALGATMDDLTSFYHDMVAGFETGVAAIVSFFSASFDNMKTMFLAFGDVFYGVWQWLSGAVGGVVNEIVLAWKTAVSTVELALNALAKGLESTFTSIGQYVMYPFKMLGHKFKKWMSDLLKSLFGTKEDPTALGTLLRKLDTDLFDKMQKTAKVMRIQWVEEGGDEFGDKYFERAAKEMEKVHAKYSERSKAIKGELAMAEDEAAKAAAQLKASQDKATAGIVDTATEATLKGVARFNEMGKEISAHSDAAFAAAADTAETSKRLRGETEDMAGEAETRQDEVKRTVRKKRQKVKMPTVSERAEMAKPKDHSTRAMMESITTMQTSMGSFFKKPLDVKVNVQGDIGKFMRFSAQHDRKTVPSTVAR